MLLGEQLSAAAFFNVCARAGFIKGAREKKTKERN